MSTASQTASSCDNSSQSDGGAKVAAAPFNLSSADVVFITSDNVEYRLHKAILSIASPFFYDMFTLAQPTPTSPGQGAITTDERIPVAEESQIFDGLMRLVYPVADPPLTERLPIEQLLEASLKYQLQEAIDVLRAALRRLIPQLPLQVFSTACRLRLKEEAQIAAEKWKAQAPWTTNSNEQDFARTLEGASYVEEMAHCVTAGTFFRLLQYLRDPTAGGHTPEFIDPPSSHVPCDKSARNALPTAKDVLTNRPVRPDIILRCCDNVDVPAYEAIIRLASADKLLASAVASTGPESTVYEVDDESEPLQRLLLFCYPFPSTSLHGSEAQLDAIMALARKYDVGKVIQLIKDHFTTLDPTTRYLLANKWGWQSEAQFAALCHIWVRGKGCSYTYTPVMEYVSATFLFNMLKEAFSRCPPAPVGQYAPPVFNITWSH